MSFVQNEEGHCLLLVDLDVYGLEPLLKTAYKFTDRCYLHLQYRSPAQVEVRFRLKETVDTSPEIPGEFMNELLDQRLRAKILEETAPIRNLIIAHALSKTSLIGNGLDKANPVDDAFDLGTPDATPRAET